MNIAIITGASSGIGLEFARQIALHYASEIDEMWLVARREDALHALVQEMKKVQRQYGISHWHLVQNW